MNNNKANKTWEKGPGKVDCVEEENLASASSLKNCWTGDEESNIQCSYSSNTSRRSSHVGEIESIQPPKHNYEDASKEAKGNGNSHLSKIKSSKQRNDRQAMTKETKGNGITGRNHYKWSTNIMEDETISRRDDVKGRWLECLLCKARIKTVNCGDERKWKVHAASLRHLNAVADSSELSLQTYLNSYSCWSKRDSDNIKRVLSERGLSNAKIWKGQKRGTHSRCTACPAQHSKQTKEVLKCGSGKKDHKTLKDAGTKRKTSLTKFKWNSHILEDPTIKKKDNKYGSWVQCGLCNVKINTKDWRNWITHAGTYKHLIAVTESLKVSLEEYVTKFKWHPKQQEMVNRVLKNFTKDSSSDNDENSETSILSDEESHCNKKPMAVRYSSNISQPPRNDYGSSSHSTSTPPSDKSRSDMYHDDKRTRKPFGSNHSLEVSSTSQQYSSSDEEEEQESTNKKTFARKPFGSNRILEVSTTNQYSSSEDEEQQSKKRKFARKGISINSQNISSDEEGQQSKMARFDSNNSSRKRSGDHRQSGEDDASKKKVEETQVHQEVKYSQQDLQEKYLFFKTLYDGAIEKLSDDSLSKAVRADTEVQRKKFQKEMNRIWKLLTEGY